MRIPGQHDRQPALQGEAMTPMIDVVFLLLVFFVCASIGQRPDALLPARLSAGVTESPLDVEPPEPEDSEHQQVRIGLRPGSTPSIVILQLNEQPVADAADLRQRLVQLSQIDPLTRIVLDVDDEATWQQFIAIYDLCQALNFESISIGVRE